MSDRTLIFLQGHSAAQDIIDRHWSFFNKAQCDLVGVGRTNTKTVWPPSPRLIATVDVGFEGYVVKGKLCQRFLDILNLFIEDSRFDNYDDAFICEVDAIFVRPLPPHGQTGRLLTTDVGGPFPGFFAPKPFHPPWWMDRSTAEKMRDAGRRMLKVGLCEKDFYDQFIGLIVALFDIPVGPAPSFSVNLIDRPDYVAAARRAIVGGAAYIHGLKTTAQLKQVTEGLNIL